MEQTNKKKKKKNNKNNKTKKQKAGMGNFLEKDKEKKLKVVPFQNK